VTRDDRIRYTARVAIYAMRHHMLIGDICLDAELESVFYSELAYWVVEIS
jgi:hypothetical protein